MHKKKGGRSIYRGGGIGLLVIAFSVGSSTSHGNKHHATWNRKSCIPFPNDIPCFPRLSRMGRTQGLEKRHTTLEGSRHNADDTAERWTTDFLPGDETTLAYTAYHKMDDKTKRSENG